MHGSCIMNMSLIQNYIDGWRILTFHEPEQLSEVHLESDIRGEQGSSDAMPPNQTLHLPPPSPRSALWTAATGLRLNISSTALTTRHAPPKRLGSPTEAPVLGAAAGGSGGGVPRQGYQRAFK